MTKRYLAVLVLAVVSHGSTAGWAQSAGSAFTYQGQLREGGAPADGSYDFRLTLYDSLHSIVGGPISFEDHIVEKGLFSLILDFGVAVLDGDARYLEVAVRPGESGGSFTVLSPMQELTPAPYASMALQTVGLDGHSLDALDGSPTDAIYVDREGEVGVGTETPTHPLEVIGVSGRAAVVGDNPAEATLGELGSDQGGVYGYAAGGSGVFGRVTSGSGVYGESDATSGWTNGVEGYSMSPGGNAVYGYNEADNGDAIGVRGVSASPNGFGGYFVGQGYFSSNVGIGTTTPASPLTVNGMVESLADGFRFPDGTVQTTASTGGGSTYWQPSSEGIYYDDGYVGVGVEYPLYSIHAIDPIRTAIGGQCVSEGTEGYLGHELAGVYGFGSIAVHGVSISPGGYAVYGSAESPTGTSFGVYGKSSSPSGRGVYGEVTGTGGYGVIGKSVGGAGVFGEANATSGWTRGVEGYVVNPEGVAVYGFNEADSGNAWAIRGDTLSPDGYAGYFNGRGYFSNNVGIGTTDISSTLTVAGTIESTGSGFKFPDGSVQSTAAVGGDTPWEDSAQGIYYDGGRVGIGTSSADYTFHVISNTGTAIWAENLSDFTIGHLASEYGGVYGESDTGRGVYGWATASGVVTNYGIYGEAEGLTGCGVFGKAWGDDGHGVHGEAAATGGDGVFGTAPDGRGVYGELTSASAIGSAVEGRTWSPDGHAIYGFNHADSGPAVAVRGISFSPTGFGGFFGGRGHFSGDVGIGTIDPTEKLDVRGTVRMNGFKLGTSAPAGYVLTTDSSGVGTWQEPEALELPLDETISSTFPAIAVENTGTGIASHGIKAAITNPSSFENAAAGLFTAIGSKGRAISAFSDDNTTIDVTHTGGKSAITATSTGLGAGSFHATGAGGVGVWAKGDAGPGLWAESDASGETNPALLVSNNNSSGICMFSTCISSDANAVFVNKGAGDLIKGFSGGTGGDLVFKVTNDGTTRASGLEINSSTSSDDDLITGHSGADLVFKVTNNGTTHTNVLQINGGSDLSEQFDVRGKEDAIEPGMVVCIDEDHPGKLTISNAAYDRKVAGIISGAGGISPGMQMGQRGSVADGEHPIALTGRVYVRSDASGGPIRPGDLLTTSGVPGHAMRVSDYASAQGAILGKAMTALEEGQGLVLVLVTLQ